MELNKIEDMVLACLVSADKPLSLMALANDVEEKDDITMFAASMLVEKGYASVTGEFDQRMYEATPAGVDLLAQIDNVEMMTVAPPTPVEEVYQAVHEEMKANMAMPRAFIHGGGTYMGAELGRTCHRPGAYDAMRIPSLHNKLPPHLKG